MQVTCPRCGYTWNYKGKRTRPVCPNCGYTFKLNKQQQRGVIVTTSPRGDKIFSVPIDDVNKINQKELWEKAGAKVIESTKDDKVVIVDVPDDKADEVMNRFQQLLEEKVKEVKRK